MMRRAEKAERDAVIVNPGQVEEGQDMDVLPKLGQADRPGDQPFGELVDDEDEGGKKKAGFAIHLPLPRAPGGGGSAER